VPSHLKFLARGKIFSRQTNQKGAFWALIVNTPTGGIVLGKFLLDGIPFVT